MKKFLLFVGFFLFSVSVLPAGETGVDLVSSTSSRVFRLGIIGTTTSHVNAFVGLLNAPDREGIYREFEVVGAYAGGMPDNPASWDRVEKIKQFVVEKGIKVHPTIERMLEEVDGVLLESVDGRCHLEQAKHVIKAGKPLFIDKPAAASLADAMEIYRLAEESKVPVFSSSSLRFSSGIRAMRTKPSVGTVLGVAAWSPSSRNETNPGLFWYGIHGVEILYTIMGTGCDRVSCVGTQDFDLATGIWADGRIGTFRGNRNGKGGFGATVFGDKDAADAGKYEGYKPLVDEFCRFFKTGISPVDDAETLEIMAFMEAAEASLMQNGKPVFVKEIMDQARNRKRVFVNLKINERKEWSINGKTVSEENLSAEIDRFNDGADTDLKIILTATGKVDRESIVKVCKQFKKATLANFLYDFTE